MSVLDQAKRLRSHRTEAEQRLWHHLRAHRFMGLNFKRQKPIGRYVVDFVRQERRVIVEVDGGHHAGQTECDRERGSWLRERGYEVLRVWNHEVMQQLDGVLERIRLAALAPSPPDPRAGEGSEVYWSLETNGERCRESSVGEDQSPGLGKVGTAVDTLILPLARCRSAASMFPWDAARSEPHRTRLGYLRSPQTHSGMFFTRAVGAIIECPSAQRDRALG